MWSVNYGPPQRITPCAVQEFVVMNYFTTNMPKGFRLQMKQPLPSGLAQ
jgi:hypothetical protein